VDPRTCLQIMGESFIPPLPGCLLFHKMTLPGMDVLEPVSKHAFKFIPGYVIDFQSQCLSQSALVPDN